MIYKNVRQMHIDVRVQLQQLAANRDRKLADGLIDWALNQAQAVLIANCVIPKTDGTPRFEISRERRETISNLVVSGHLVSASRNTDYYQVRVPANLLYLLVDESQVNQLCKGTTITQGYQVEKLTSVSLPLSTKSAGPYYDTVQIIYNGETIFDIATLQTEEQSGYTGMEGIEDHFYIRDLIISALNRKGYAVYWEKTVGLYKPNHLIFLTTGTAPSITTKVDGVDSTGTTTEHTVTTENASSIPVFAPNTMSRPDRTPFMQVTPYFKTSSISPVSQLEEGEIKVFADNSFIVSNMRLSYVRKPAQISLTLGTDCELAAPAHQLLCDMAVEQLQQRIGDPRWQDTAAQNLVKKNS